MPTATDYNAHLSDRSMRALGLLLGAKIQWIYCTGFELEADLAFAWTFAIRRARHRWIQIASRWLETPANAHDFLELQVDVAEGPQSIVVRDPEEGPMNLLLPARSLRISPSAVEEIRILHRSIGDEGEGPDDDFLERVTYDHALVLRQEDGSQLCISADRAIMGRLAVTTDPAAVAVLVRGCTGRDTIQRCT